MGTYRGVDMHTEVDIEASVYGVIAEVSGTTPDEIGPAWALDETHGIDSLDFVALVQQVEGALDIRLPDEEVAGVTTAGELLALCRQKRSETGGAGTPG